MLKSKHFRRGFLSQTFGSNPPKFVNMFALGSVYTTWQSCRRRPRQSCRENGLYCCLWNHLHMTALLPSTACRAHWVLYPFFPTAKNAVHGTGALSWSDNFSIVETVVTLWQRAKEISGIYALIDNPNNHHKLDFCNWWIFLQDR